MGVYREEAEETSDAITKITKCILEDGTVYEYVLCSENRDNDFVDLRFMEYLGIGKKYSAAGSMHVNTEKKYHFWKKKEND